MATIEEWLLGLLELELLDGYKLLLVELAFEEAISELLTLLLDATVKLLLEIEEGDGLLLALLELIAIELLTLLLDTTEELLLEREEGDEPLLALLELIAIELAKLLLLQKIDRELSELLLDVITGSPIVLTGNT